MFKKNFLLCLLFLGAVHALLGCKKESKSWKSQGIQVSEYNQVFSVDKVQVLPGEAISFDLFNGLKSENLKFILLKKGEDPIVVQHLRAQQGEVPQDYTLYQSEDIAPQTKAQVQFKAPTEEGEYIFVGISGEPRESLMGTLVVQSPRVAQRGADKTVKGAKVKVQ